MKKYLFVMISVAGVLAIAAGLLTKNIGAFKTSPVAADTISATLTMAPDLPEIWVPVLVYHHIGIPPSRYTSAEKSLFIAPEWFEKHLQYLKDNGFETIHFEDVVAYFETGMPLPARPVIISFDDGNGNAYSAAFPLLKKYGMTGTFFLVTNYLDHGAHLTWKQVEEMRDAGMEIGSHSVSHPYLTKSSHAHKEIFDSKKILEEKLGISISAFAYPFGNYNQPIENAVKEAGYKIGRSFSTGNGISPDKMFHVPVVRVYANVGLERWEKQLFKENNP